MIFVVIILAVLAADSSILQGVIIHQTVAWELHGNLQDCKTASQSHGLHAHRVGVVFCTSQFAHLEKFNLNFSSSSFVSVFVFSILNHPCY